MVKIVDHDERRLQLARAVWAVISTSGLRGATVRAVAQEAGVSPGSLRHYFSDQRGLLRFAALHMTQQVASRITAHVEAGDGGRQTARAILLECLPVDEARRIECAVWIEALVQSRYDPELTLLREEGHAGARHVCRTAWAFEAGITLPEWGSPLAEPHETCAGLLHAYLDGLTLQSTTAPSLTGQTLTRRLDTMLDTLRAAYIER